MKKIAMVCGLTTLLILGSACGGGNDWSDEDKADFELGIAAGEAFGLWTDKQGDCLKDWAFENFDSLEEMDQIDPDSVEATKAYTELLKECDIDFDALADWEG